MSSIKPTRTELIDMIIRKISDKMVEERLEIQREKNQVDNQIVELEKEKSLGQFDYSQKQEQVQLEINEVLKKHRLSEISIYVDTQREYKDNKETWEVFPTFHISESRGKSVKPKPTKVIDRKISVLHTKSKDLHGDINTMNIKIREFDLQNKYKSHSNSDLRSKVVQMLCETDEAVVQAVSVAARVITEKSATELLETIHAR